jgi:hypothetical protein
MFLEKKGHVEFFDSFGQFPGFYGHAFERFVRKHGGKSAFYSDVQVQSPSAKTCGAHVIFYLIHRCLDNNMKEIYPLHLPPSYHDTIVNRFLLTLTSELINK